MATSTSAPVLLLLAAVVLLHPATSLACGKCPPNAPGCGCQGHPSYPSPGGGSPTWPSPGSGSGCGCGGHNRPPHHCPPCKPPTWPSPGSGSGCGCGPNRPPHHCPPCNPPALPSPGCGCGHNRPPHCPPCNPPASPTCPIDTLKLNACVDVLSGLLHLVIGQEARAKCCPLVQGIADLDAALCLCTSLRLRLLNLNVYLPVALNLLVTCGKHPPPGFQCPLLSLSD